MATDTPLTRLDSLIVGLEDRLAAQPPTASEPNVGALQAVRDLALILRDHMRETAYLPIYDITIE